MLKFPNPVVYCKCFFGRGPFAILFIFDIFCIPSISVPLDYYLNVKSQYNNNNINDNNNSNNNNYILIL